MTIANRLLLPNDQIIHMGWVGEKLIHNNQTMLDWKPRFLALRGSNIYIFDRPPVSGPMGTPGLQVGMPGNESSLWTPIVINYEGANIC